MTTIVPAQAFAESHPSEVAIGCLFKTRGSWALRVKGGPDPNFEGYILLQGERAGQLLRLAPGMAAGLTIIKPFSWFPGIHIDAKLDDSCKETASLSLTEAGPVIVGGIADSDHYDSDFFAYQTDGQRFERFDHYKPIRRFSQWSVELQHDSRPLKSLGQILTVDRRKT
jgi:hypothetical protein